MNEIKCIFCETLSDRIAIEENGYQGKRCQKCGLIYISPRPSLNQIIDLYGHDDAHITAESHIADDFAKRLYAKHHLKIISSFAEGGKLLEVGAGAGYFLDEARSAGFEPYGLEFNPVQANFVRNELNIPCEESPLDHSVFAGKRFDVVYHCDVISHLFDPIADFQQMNQRMKDDSVLVFETGNLGEVDPKYLDDIDCFQYPDHLFFFGTENLARLLKQTGFELVNIYRYSISPQLTTKKILSKFKKSILSLLKSLKKESNSPSKVVISHQNKKHNINQNQFKSIIRQKLKNAYLYSHRYFMYLLRYKLGSIAPKANKPQTVIVIAKKVSPIK